MLSRRQPLGGCNDLQATERAGQGILKFLPGDTNPKMMEQLTAAMAEGPQAREARRASTGGPAGSPPPKKAGQPHQRHTADSPASPSPPPPGDSLPARHK